ncbi:MAG: 50S ribosomal protein L22 [Alphaproteobacteria bacterium]|nr:50S ribosomal protein L22 [Rickettsiales bacterium]
MNTDIDTCSATLKYVPSSTYKWELVATLIRNMTTEKALEQLSVSKKACAVPMIKLVKSCIANAVNNNGFDREKLIVYKVFVGKAFTLRRFMACGRGRSTRIEKRYSKITVVLKKADIVVSAVDLKSLNVTASKRSGVKSSKKTVNISSGN